MSKTIDEKVVSMQFDNKDFEANVKTSMSTLDKLKQALNLKDSSKSLENVSTAAKKCDFNPMAQGLESVKSKFSALEVMGVTALANITNSAVNAGKRLVSAFTIDPVKSGLSEYELKMNSVQTIMMSTGESVETVNQYLNELNEYSDRTIYSFQDMTSNIGKFTNAGVKLEDAVAAIKGISNEAAVSGANANEASRAMYNFSQALSAGYVKLIDWKSIENANMATVEFKQQLIDTAVEMGTLTQTTDGLYNTGKTAISSTLNFNDSLQDQWMTSEVLVETLKKYTDETTDIGKKSYEAAEKVKTFSQMMDVLKETAQSGWAQTWETIFGNLEEAKALFTPLTNFFSGIIASVDDVRNTFLKGVLGSPIGTLMNKVSAFAETTSEAVETVEDLGEVVQRVINGEFGTGQDRFDKLTEAGYNWAKVQNDVNEELGNSFRHTVELDEAQQKQTESQQKQTESLNTLTDEKLVELGLTETEIKLYRELEQQSKLTGKSMSQLTEEYENMSGRTLLIESFKNIGQGLVNVFGAVKEAWHSIFTTTIEERISNAYNLLQLFHAKTKSFLENLKSDGDTIDKITRTLKGLFAVLDLIKTVVGGGFSFAIKIASAVLDKMGLGVLDVTAIIGDVIVKIHDWITSNGLITKSINLIADGIVYVIEHIKKWFDSFKNTEIVQESLSIIVNLIEKIKGIIDPLKELDHITFNDFLNAVKQIRKAIVDAFTFDEVSNVAKKITSFKQLFEVIRDQLSSGNGLFGAGSNIVDGLVNGIRDRIGSVVSSISDIANKVIQTFCAILGIHSPSTVMEEKGANIIDGLFNGLQNGAGKIIEFISGLASKVVEAFQNFNWGSAFAGVFSGTMLYSVVKFAKSLEAFSAPAEGLGHILNSTGDVVEAFADKVPKLLKTVNKLGKAVAFDIKTDAIKDLAIAIAILAASVYLLARIEPAKLWNAVGAIAVLAVVLAGLSLLADKLTSTNNSMKETASGLANTAKLGTMLLALSVTLLAMAAVVKIVGGMKPEEASQGLAALSIMMIAMIGLVVTFGTFVSADKGGNITKVGSMMIKISVALLLMVAVMKITAGMKPEEFTNGAICIAAFVGIVAALMYLSKFSGENASKVGTMMLKISVALLVMVAVVKLLAGMEMSDILKGVAAIMLFSVVIGALMLVGKLAGDGGKVGLSLLAVSAALLVMTGIVKIMAGMSEEDINKGINCIKQFALIIAELIIVARLAGKGGNVAANILAMSISIAILAGVCIVLSLIDLGGLAKGVAAVTILGVLMAILIRSTKGANNVKGSIIAMAVAIGVMAASVAILSFIEPSKLYPAVGAMVLLMGMFALMEKAAGSVNKGMGVMIVMTVALGIMTTSLILLKDIPWESLVASAGSLSLLMLSFASSMKIIGSVGSVSKSALAGIIVMGLVLAEVGLVLGLMQHFNIQPSIETAVAMSTLLIALSAACLIVSYIPATGALPGSIALAEFIGVMAIVLAALGGLSKIPGFNELIADGGQTLALIGQAIGMFVGSIVGGVGVGLTATLPAMADNLSEFINRLTPFIDGAKSLDSSVLDNIGNLGKAILLITAADLLEGITSWLTGGSSLTDFANQLVPLGEAIAAFSETVAGKIDEGSVTAAANAGKILAEMAKTLPNSGGLLGAIMGENELGDFAKQLVPFGEAIAAFSETVAGKIDEEAVTAAANAGKVMAEMAETIPNTGGLLAFLAGDNDMATFGTQLKSFGDSIVAFSESVSGKINEEAITAAASAGETMVKLAETIPNTGGLISFLTGDNNIADFGTQLVTFGDAMADFSDSVLNLNVEAMDNASKAGTSLAKIAKTVSENSGWFKDDLSDFGDSVEDLGDGLSAYSESISGVDTGKMIVVATQCKKLVSLASDISHADFGGIDDFVDGINKLGKISFDDFAKGFDDAKSRMETVGKNMYEGIKSGMSSTKESVIKVVGELVSGCIKKVDDTKSKFKASGEKIVSSIASGISGSKTKVSSAIGVSLSTAINTISSTYYSQFKDLGSSLVDGFSSGITSNTYKADAASRAMAKSAYDAAKKQLDVNSPSKVFRKLAYSVPEGFAMGIDRMAYLAEDSASDMASLTINSTKDALKTVVDAVNGDIDATPTIRPVLDLNDLKSGVGTMNNILSGSSLNLLSNTGAISSMMNRRQNGNNDVVSAITKLGEDIANSSRDTYNVNGISYSEGTEMSDAIQAIVRAARIERRA